MAPSPTGLVHVGNARTALVAWLSVRSQGGTLVWRLEDLDTPRVVAGAAAAASEDLAWLGLDWDESPELGGPYVPYRQSERAGHYEAALGTLARSGRLFPCRLTRKDLRGIATAPHGPSGAPPYPPELRPEQLTEDWYQKLCDARDTAASDAALRFLVDDTPVSFLDRVQGPVTERVDLDVGDFVLRRRDRLFAYQLAVVVDDIAMGIDDVVRGADLLDSTARQIQLIEALSATAPRYAHVPLVLNEAGEKLSKRDEALTLRSLRENGVEAEQLVGYLAHSLGLLDTQRAVSAAELINEFGWDKLGKVPMVLPHSLAETLRAVR